MKKALPIISSSKVTMREDVSFTRMNYNYVFEGKQVSEDPMYEPPGFYD